ncbi:MAG: hypothetical protein ABW151_03525, partial [Pseudorhodoplanes sp.]
QARTPPNITSVMAGLAPAIRAFTVTPIQDVDAAPASLRGQRKLDGERGHDGSGNGEEFRCVFADSTMIASAWCEATWCMT